MMQQTVPINQGPMTQGAQELPLRGLHLPAEPGFWPLAPGWWLLAGVLLLLFVYLTYRWLQRRKRQQRLLAIEKQLGAIDFAYQSHQDQRQLLSDLSMLLRRFEKFQQHQDQAVTTSGAEWITHLNRYHKDQPFAPYQALLTQGVYLPEVEFDSKALIDLLGQHIKKVVMMTPKQLAKINFQEAKNV